MSYVPRYVATGQTTTTTRVMARRGTSTPTTGEREPCPPGTVRGGYVWIDDPPPGHPAKDARKCGLPELPSEWKSISQQCYAAGYAPQVCRMVKTGDTMEDVARYAKQYGGRTTVEQRPAVLKAECEAAGVPFELLEGCVAARMAGVSLSDYLKEINKLSADELAAMGVGQQAAAEAAAAAAAAEEEARRARNRSHLLFGGIAAVAVGGVLLWKRRRTK